jgi:hypothetical protein
MLQVVERRPKAWAGLTSESPIEKRLASVQRRRANSKWEAGQKEASLRILRRARSQFPNDSLVALSLGTKLFQLKQTREARQALLACLENDPGNVRAFEFFRELEKEFPLSGSRRRALLDAMAETYDPGAPDWAAKLFFVAGSEKECPSVDAMMSEIRSRGTGMDGAIVRFLTMSEEERATAHRSVMERSAAADVAPALLACEVIRGRSRRRARSSKLGVRTASRPTSCDWRYGEKCVETGWATRRSTSRHTSHR